MEITEVRIKLMEASEDRLRAFCSITIDDAFVVRDLKIIEGSSGPFVAMPSRKLTERCSKCGYKNHLRSNYCNQCGVRIQSQSSRRESDSNANKLYADIAHPINQGCRDVIQQAVISEYTIELERAKLPGYISRYDDEYSETARQIPTDQAPEFFDLADEQLDDRKRRSSSAKDRFDAAKMPDGIAESPHLDAMQNERNRTKVEKAAEEQDNMNFGAGILDDAD